MAQATKAEPNGKELSQTTQQALERFRDMGMLIPEIEGDGGMGIVADIMNATSLEDLDRTWQEKDNDKLLDLPMLIHGIERGESDFKDGLGLFLVVRATVLHSGEDVVFSTGSVSVVAQLVKAYSLDALPFVARLVKAKKQSKNGYYPQHLEIEQDQSRAQS